ncbi:anthranilate phosphoribosyltransferase [Capnocytophaga sp. oral taxon 863 str. F0517]|uniref:anthranilate phosphoribosyltransferase n=1 Tax=Capnocytophaga sp. oral taxon 863 TaxID=1227265 RepID=UPI0003963E71|nr:anthranilate phosphoribosyltransferase [Capnocytophaga sp. oral taxon 863]ERI62018.1 anthranilate phosphoribosyltransferase [Capnocytophaga sp. oral taxon 863 str. F0517]
MILLIDNYDSFVFNVAQYLQELTDEEVRTVRNDAITWEQITALQPSRIILSPGPKHPKDSGVCLEILLKTTTIPVLGICLGHQAFGLVNGAEIKRMEVPLHGKTSTLTVTDDNTLLFRGLPKQFQVMRYHSLYVGKEQLPENIRVTALSEDDIIMALEHQQKPIYSIQFHPESFFTEYGKHIIKNFITHTQKPKPSTAEDYAQEKARANEVFKAALKKLQENIPLVNEDFREICAVISEKQYDMVQLGALLVLISEKSLYPESLTAFVRNILAYSTTFADESPMIDLCGTGGDGLRTINISTTVAFIVAAMGVKVAKHGNRSVTSQSGSSDVLGQLGVPLENNLLTQLEHLQKEHLAFFHAPFFHPLVGEVKEVRQRLGIRTVFNVLGPLLHPNTKLKYQLVGLYHEPVQRLYAETLQLLGRKHALVVRGNDGLDEITLCDETKIVEVKDGKILEYTIAPEMFGFKRAFHADIQGGTPEENAAILLRMLKGEEQSPKSDIVILNAMFALYTADFVKHPAEAKPLIEEAIRSGKVYEHYLKMINTDND